LADGGLILTVYEDTLTYGCGYCHSERSVESFECWLELDWSFDREIPRCLGMARLYGMIEFIDYCHSERSEESFECKLEFVWSLNHEIPRASE
jgi:hypothetical protein